ncbi:DUF928 domain-containing protein [Gloeobacter morelensis]|uniref:DUF928 domain-containing protein n=1 Tax=Gloeobacter morelensis MG652769 TaxID=2781736 RepID=A0ABY3PJ83_9CYAN|nr:DUF928 domain-containing protein [Gloeobacter morelensis]UFP93703.1 DUF928 domain-containing protein [Gloeobacter morelensis MG652769]
MPILLYRLAWALLAMSVVWRGWEAPAAAGETPKAPPPARRNPGERPVQKPAAPGQNFFKLVRTRDRRLPAQRVRQLRSAGCDLPVPAPLTALAPGSSPGLTQVAHPTFLWHLPTLGTAAPPVLFTLESREGHLLYQAHLDTSGLAPGGVALALPSEAPPLTPGQDYHWSVTLLCDPDDPSANVTVDAWISRVVPGVAWKRRLEQAPPAERTALLAEEAYWYDLLPALTALHRTATGAPLAAGRWQSLLRSEGLDVIAGALPVPMFTGISPFPVALNRISVPNVRP